MKPKQSAIFHDFVMQDLFADIPGVTSRAMFGGYGLYKNGIIFAIIADGRLYFKVNDANRADYKQAGSKPFTYTMPGKKPMTMSYWELPEDVMEDREKIGTWVRRAVQASVTEKSKKRW